MITKTLLINP